MSNELLPVVTVKRPIDKNKNLKVDVEYNMNELNYIDMDDIYCDYEELDDEDKMDTTLCSYAIALDPEKNWALVKDKFGNVLLISPKKKGKK